MSGILITQRKLKKISKSKIVVQCHLWILWTIWNWIPLFQSLATKWLKQTHASRALLFYLFVSVAPSGNSGWFGKGGGSIRPLKLSTTSLQDAAFICSNCIQLTTLVAQRTWYSPCFCAQALLTRLIYSQKLDWCLRKAFNQGRGRKCDYWLSLMQGCAIYTTAIAVAW